MRDPVQEPLVLRSNFTPHPLRLPLPLPPDAAASPAPLPARAAWRSRLAPPHLQQALLLRAGVLALVLGAYATALHQFAGAGLLPQYLAALLLALATTTLLTLLDLRADTGDRAAPAAAAPSSEAGAVHFPAVEPATDLVAGLESTKAFDDAVRRAITHLSDPTRLAVSPLLHLSQVSAGLQERRLEDTRFNRALLLRDLLTALVQGLHPLNAADSCTGAGHRYYNCLYYPYVRGISRRQAPTVLRRLRERREQEGGERSEQEQVLGWLLQVEDDTYYKWQRRASDSIALIVRERETAAGSTMLGVANVGLLMKACR